MHVDQFKKTFLSFFFLQVAYAAQTLCIHPDSHFSVRNMVLFREAWSENIQLLISSLEALAPLNQFMTVVGQFLSSSFSLSLYT